MATRPGPIGDDYVMGTRFVNFAKIASIIPTIPVKPEPNRLTSESADQHGSCRDVLPKRTWVPERDSQVRGRSARGAARLLRVGQWPDLGRTAPDRHAGGCRVAGCERPPRLPLRRCGR